MPRRLFKKFMPAPHLLRDRWFVRAFGPRMGDPALWSPQRRAVSGAFGAGLAICFVPLPVHIPLAALIALLWRLNVPAIIATVFLVNPVTVVPMYYLAFRVGSALLGLPPQGFTFQLSWDWLQHGLGPVWRPFLLGCLVCGTAAGLAGGFALEFVWRASVRKRYRARRARSTRGNG
jgi:uncharacterized protein